MSRRQIREHLFRILFRKEFHNREELEEQMEFYFESLTDPNQEDVDYIRDKFLKILEKTDEIDTMIEEAAKGWKLNRLGKIDLTILRLAVFEMKYDDEIPVSVAINEAVEIAKIFGEENSPGFINGILASFA